jgi:hypothetical protein
VYSNSEIDPRANFKYPDLKKQVKKAVTPVKKKEDKKGVQYWASGTGYGHDSAKSTNVFPRKQNKKKEETIPFFPFLIY